MEIEKPIGYSFESIRLSNWYPRRTLTTVKLRSDVQLGVPLWYRWSLFTLGCLWVNLMIFEEIQ